MTQVDTSLLETIAAPSDIRLAEVSALAAQLVQLEDDVAAAELALTAKKAELQEMRIKHLPEAMKAVGLRKFELDNGVQIDVKPDVAVTIPVAERASVYRWLQENGHGSIVKNKFELNFGKGDADRARELTQLLDQNGYDFSTKEDIHAQTLKAWVREQLREGNELPEALKVFEFEAAKVKRPKAEA